MRKKISRLTNAILSMAKDMHEDKIINEADYEKITMRHLKEKDPPSMDRITGE